MDVVLVVNIKPDDRKYLTGGFRASDRFAPHLRDFCSRHRIPYSDTFVSISVHADCVAPGSASKCYGEFALYLKRELMAEIVVVCEDDFQDTVKHAFDRENAGQIVAAYRRQIHVLNGDIKARQRVLYDLASGNPSKYVEARVFRPITWADVARTDDSSLGGALERLAELLPGSKQTPKPNSKASPA